MADRRLILFARYPVAGRVKTRLVPALGAEGAAGLHRRLVLRTLRTAARFCAAEGIALEVRFDGGSAGTSQPTIAVARGATVLGPATDGGYYLVGLTRPAPELFRGIAWGTDEVLAATLRALARRGEEPILLEPLADLDRPEDLPAWEGLVAAEEASLARISVVIPALNEARAISA
ncbi:MAG TPA: TIGR04282 family arsenosugar biosynthesis glycosyltransferase, partial [Myxococcota bacterium]|nr:TIGR04282 family arsenosugar biosynthesis glycosyltransferase [Myxococcota bacterium]